MKVWVVSQTGDASEFSTTLKEIQDGMARGYLQLERDGETLFIPTCTIRVVSAKLDPAERGFKR